MNIHLPPSVRTQVPLQINLRDVSPTNNALINTLTEIITNLIQGTITPFDAGKEIELLIGPLNQDILDTVNNILDICYALEANPPPSPIEIISMADVLIIYLDQIENAVQGGQIPYSDLAAGYLNYESTMISQTGQYDRKALLGFLETEVDKYKSALPPDIVNMLDDLEKNLKFAKIPPPAPMVAEDLANLGGALHDLAHPPVSAPSGLENTKLALRVASAVHGLN